MILFIQINRDYYIWNIKWLNKNSIIIVYVNRKQNKAMIVINDVSSGSVVLIKVIFLYTWIKV